MLDEREGILICEADLDYENEIREQLPLLKARRNDVYGIERSSMFKDCVHSVRSN